MKKFLSLIAVLVLCLVLVSEGQAMITADEFMPLVQAPEEQREELAKVQSPDEVRTESSPETSFTTTKARTLQDAINNFIKPIKRRGIEARVTGAQRVQSGSGYAGYVATGRGIYDKDMKNINAVRISQRTAYVLALIDAKREMITMLNEMQASGEEIFTNDDNIENTATTPSGSGGTQLEEKGSSQVAAVLKGYVTYSVFDDGAGSVYVTIVCTPKTMGSQQRPDGKTLIAGNLRDGINTVLAEIQSGVVPPVGGRTITVPDTGEMGFVGFGSAIVQTANKPAAQLRQERIAERIATMRAESELSGIIGGGDNIESQTANSEQVRQEFGDEALSVEDSDPVNKLVSESDFAEANAVRESFMHNRAFNEAVRTARAGTLPPGVNRISWTDEEGVWAYAAAVYIPSVSEQTISDVQAMREAQTQSQPQQSGESKQAVTQNNNQETERVNSNSGVFKPGVSGTINQDL